METQTNNPTVKEEIKTPPTTPTQPAPVNPGNLQVAKTPEQEKATLGNEKVAGTPSKTL